MFSPFVSPEIILGSVLVHVRPLGLQLGLDRVEGLRVEGKARVAVQGAVAVTSGRPDAVDRPTAFDFK